MAWVPKIPKECHDGIDANLDTTAIFLGLVVAINVATLTKVFLFYKSTDMDSEEIKTKLRKNRALFLQTMIQDAIILADMFFTLRIRYVQTSIVHFFISLIIVD